MDLGSQSLRHGGIGLRDVISKLLFVGLESRGDLGVVDHTVCGFFRCQDQFSPHPGQFGGRPLLSLVFRVHHWAFKRPMPPTPSARVAGRLVIRSHLPRLEVLLVVIESDVQAMTSS
jgi:hypothetical protein